MEWYAYLELAKKTDKTGAVEIHILQTGGSHGAFQSDCCIVDAGQGRELCHRRCRSQRRHVNIQTHVPSLLEPCSSTVGVRRGTGGVCPVCPDRTHVAPSTDTSTPLFPRPQERRRRLGMGISHKRRDASLENMPDKSTVPSERRETLCDNVTQASHLVRSGAGRAK